MRSAKLLSSLCMPFPLISYNLGCCRELHSVSGMIRSITGERMRTVRCYDRSSPGILYDTLHHCRIENARVTRTRIDADIFCEPETREIVFAAQEHHSLITQEKRHCAGTYHTMKREISLRHTKGRRPFSPVTGKIDTDIVHVYGRVESESKIPKPRVTSRKCPKRRFSNPPVAGWKYA